MKSQNFQNIVQDFDTIKSVSVNGLYIVVNGVISNTSSQKRYEYKHSGVARAVASKVVQFKGV